jgi:TldD protein
MMATPQDGPGSFDIVFDGYAMASIVDNSLGTALELDRVMGYEANAAGTSYLAPPETILGSAIVPPSVTLTAERSAPTGAATVKWDAEGVVPSEFTLVKKGVAVDYATSREFAQSLASWYGKQRQPVRSNGCAGAEDAMSVQLIQAPNTTLHPDTKNTSFEDLVAGVDKGLAVLGGSVMIDHQQLNGEGFGEMVYAIKKGKLAGTVSGAAYLFRSPQFWKNLVALGGAQTSVTRGSQANKGQPQQTTAHSVTAVAAHVKDMRVMDIRASTEAARMRMRP